MKHLLGPAAALFLGITTPFLASATSPATAETQAPIVVSGTVPDETARAAIISQLVKLYGAHRVLDQLEVGTVTPPPNWASNVAHALTPSITDIRQGQIRFDGTHVSLSGQVPSVAKRQQLATEIASALNPSYTVNNALVVNEDGQTVLDSTLGARVVEFEVGSSTLTAGGTVILDEMAVAILSIDPPAIQIVGHTDSTGERLANIALSLDRANTVRDYLIAKGIAPERLTALGAGPDRPLVSNDTAAGRSRNRRIEFSLMQ